MIGLISSEGLRARSRRIVWVLLATALLGTLVGVVIAMVNAERPEPSAIERGERQWQRGLDECEAGGYFSEGEIPAGMTLEQYCAENLRREYFVPEPDLMLADLPEIVEGAAAMLSVLGIVLGASLAGADWSTGAMTTVLTWEPRRARVWLVRAGVAAVVVMIAIALLILAFTVLWWIAAAIGGSTETSGGFIGDVLTISLRVILLAAVFGLLAHALASLGRSTIAGVGILFGYAVIFEGFVAGLAESIQPKLLVRAATVIVSGNPMLHPRADAAYGPDGAILEADPGAIWLDVPGAWVVVAIYVAVLGALSILAFRARDVQ